MQEAYPKYFSKETEGIKIGDGVSLKQGGTDTPR